MLFACRRAWGVCPPSLPTPPPGLTARGGALRRLGLRVSTRASSSASPAHATSAPGAPPAGAPPPLPASRRAEVKLYEMGPRDGLQNEATAVPTAVKVAFIDALSRSGLSHIEATSFVSRAWVPQLGDAAEVCAGMARAPGVTYSALVPNARGLEGALAARLPEIAVFAAATDSFSRRNINVGVQDSFLRFKPVLAAAAAAGVRVRGYVSCALGCPYDGPVAPDAVGFVAQSLLELGCYEVSLGDTIGVGTPPAVRRLLAAVRAHVPVEAIALHCHDTYGMGVANVLAALDAGVTVFDASVAGLGGCPYARGASGNVATEDVAYALAGAGVHTGVDVDALVDAGAALCAALGRPNRSKVAVARLAQRAALAAAEGDVRRLEQEAAAAGGGGGAGGGAGGGGGGAGGGGEGGGGGKVDAVAALAKARARAADARIGLRWPERPEEASHAHHDDALAFRAAAAHAAAVAAAAAGH